MVCSCLGRQHSVNNVQTGRPAGHVGHDLAIRWVGVVEIHLGCASARSPVRCVYSE